MLSRTIAAIVPLLSALASPVVAGVLAALAFDALRQRFPMPQQAPASRAGGLLLWLLYAPLGARIASSGMSILIAVGAGLLLAAFTGGDLISTADAILAAFVGPFVASLTHGLRWLSRELPAPTPEAAATIQARLEAL